VGIFQTELSLKNYPAIFISQKADGGSQFASRLIYIYLLLEANCSGIVAIPAI
jgi:hypothetical protein